MYSIELGKGAARQVKKLPPEALRRIAKKLDELAGNPRPAGVKKLQGEEELYRVRVGGYRMVYQIQDRRLVVLVVAVGDRKDVYKKR